MLSLLTGLRHKMRMIRYYSASRPESAWTKASDFALIASFFLALPIAWLASQLVVRTSVPFSLGGQVFVQPDSSYFAILMSASRSRSMPVDASAIGMFVVEVEDHQRGWPLTTSMTRAPARLDLDLRTDPAPRRNVQLPADDPLRAAIVEALRREGENDVLAAWDSSTPVTLDQSSDESRSAWKTWMVWIFAAGIWWIMLTVGSAAAIQLAKFATMVISGKQAVRRAILRAEGKCQHCGYDMTGLEFNERCPECGQVVW